MERGKIGSGIITPCTGGQGRGGVDSTTPLIALYSPCVSLSKGLGAVQGWKDGSLHSRKENYEKIGKSDIGQVVCH
ncbi:hypothetical protein ES703_78086 [subsurface metagenome]